MHICITNAISIESKYIYIYIQLIYIYEREQPLGSIWRLHFHAIQVAISNILNIKNNKIIKILLFYIIESKPNYFNN